MTFARLPTLPTMARFAPGLLVLGLLGGCVSVGLDAPAPGGPSAVSAAPVVPDASAAAAKSTVADLARAGDAEAQATLGWIYETGRGVARDPARAALWYERAALQGNTLAQYALAELYSRGHGVPRDDDAAARLYRAAAEGGNASAQYKLGALYETGRGVPRDYRLAAYWYARAGETWAATANPPPGIERVTGPPAAPVLVPPTPAPAPSEDAAVKAGLALLPEGAETPGSDAEAAPPAAWRVHLASFRTRRGAARARAEIEEKAGDAIAGYGFDLVDVDLGKPLGAWVRVTLGPLKGRAAARALCRRLEARDLYCRPLAPGQ